MKTRILILSVLIIIILASVGYPQLMLRDAFNSFDPALWEDYSHDGGYAAVENGYFSFGTTQGTIFSKGSVSSNFSLSGDFITNIDFDLVSFNDFFSSATFGIWARDNSFAMLMTRKLDVNSMGYIEGVHFMVDGTWQTEFSMPTEDMTGKLRLGRSGSTLSAYYYSAGDWQLVNNVLLPLGYDSPVRVFIEVGNDGIAGNAPAVEAHYDNFMADGSNITGVDSRYIIAQPEPGTIILLGSGLLGLGALGYLRRRK